MSVSKQEKESVYFPHFVSARHDRKIRRVRKDLGIEGYGIFFMILEVLREQSDLKYPIEDIDLLADEFGTSEEKLKVVINKYGLFEFDDGHFYSPNQILYLKPYFEKSKRAKHAALMRWGNNNANANANALPEHSKSNASKESKESNLTKGSKKLPTIPELSEVIEYFAKKGYDKEHAVRFFDYYNEPMKDRNGRVWKDQNGKTVNSWKQKAISVWFKEENKPKTDNYNTFDGGTF